MQSVSGAEAACEPVPLPCQDSHNSTEHVPPGDQKPLKFPSSAARTAFSLQCNVEAMVQAVGLEHVGFLTLTFREHILDPREAQRRMNSLMTHVIRPRYKRAVRVIERQKNGRIHYHLLVAIDADIRSGCDFEAFARGDYRSAPAALRAEWHFWNDRGHATAKKHGFGRTELLPVRSTGMAVSRYVGKYIGKHIEARKPEDRRVRLVSYVGDKVASTRFAWATGGGAQWRAKLKAFVMMLYDSGAIASPTLFAMRMKFGPRWARYWRDVISTYPIEEGDGERGSSRSELAPPPLEVSPC